MIVSAHLRWPQADVAKLNGALDRPTPPRRTSLYSFFAYPSAASSRKAMLLSQAAIKAEPAAPLSNRDTIQGSVLKATPPTPLGPPTFWSIQLPLFAVVCLAAACFLAGSLLRSLLVHSEDYIMFLPVGADTANIDAPSDWAEMRKLVQIPLFRWDIVVGVVRPAAR